MPDISKLLYCALSMLYVNAIFTNICYQKLRFPEQLGIFLYATILYYVLSPTYKYLIIITNSHMIHTVLPPLCILIITHS